MKEPINPSKLNVVNNKLHRCFALTNNAKSISLSYAMTVAANVIKSIKNVLIKKLTTS